MKISSINNFYNQKMQYPPKRVINNTFSSDIFFCGKKDINDLTVENLIKWADGNYLDSVDINSENAKGKLLGTGYEGAVYEIPGTTNWVLKEFHRSKFLPLKVQKASIRRVEDIIPNLNVGQTIACLDIPCGANYAFSYHIRKRQEGVELGVKPQDWRYFDKEDVENHLASLKMLANAPQSTFDSLITIIKQVYDAGYELDCCNSNNFLFDEEEQEINIIDVNDRRCYDINQFGDVLYAILDTGFYVKFSSEEKYSQSIFESKHYSDEIIKKFILAMQKQNQKFNSTNFFEKLISTDLLDKFLQVEEKEEKLNRLRELNLL